MRRLLASGSCSWSTTWKSFASARALEALSSARTFPASASARRVSWSYVDEDALVSWACSLASSASTCVFSALNCLTSSVGGGLLASSRICRFSVSSCTFFCRSCVIPASCCSALIFCFSNSLSFCWISPFSLSTSLRRLASWACCTCACTPSSFRTNSSFCLFHSALSLDTSVRSRACSDRIFVISALRVWQSFVTCARLSSTFCFSCANFVCAAWLCFSLLLYSSGSTVLYRCRTSLCRTSQEFTASSFSFTCCIACFRASSDSFSFCKTPECVDLRAANSLDA
mmetsp:Transcript_43336/g.114259  ORF Transcript_43336/g.114259 Transcript_43336/m.114259 type:complete len:286 (-) Transcript_43336:847-1704(-)